MEHVGPDVSSIKTEPNCDEGEGVSSSDMDMSLPVIKKENLPPKRPSELEAIACASNEKLYNIVDIKRRCLESSMHTSEQFGDLTTADLSAVKSEPGLAGVSDEEHYGDVDIKPEHLDNFTHNYQLIGSFPTAQLFNVNSEPELGGDSDEEHYVDIDIKPEYVDNFTHIYQYVGDLATALLPDEQGPAAESDEGTEGDGVPYSEIDITFPDIKQECFKNSRNTEKQTGCLTSPPHPQSADKEVLLSLVEAAQDVLEPISKALKRIAELRMASNIIMKRKAEAEEAANIIRQRYADVQKAANAIKRWQMKAQMETNAIKERQMDAFERQMKNPTDRRLFIGELMKQ